MKCTKCERNFMAADLMYCAGCGSVYCPECQHGLCDCLGDLKYFS